MIFVPTENDRTVTGMVEYIDFEESIRMIRGSVIKKYPLSFPSGISASANELEKLPVADVATVVHAEWIDIVFDPMRRSMTATCSHCMVRGEVRAKSNECGFAVPDSDFCPSCGAKMDLRRDGDGT